MTILELKKEPLADWPDGRLVIAEVPCTLNVLQSWRMRCALKLEDATKLILFPPELPGTSHASRFLYCSQYWENGWGADFWYATEEEFNGRGRGWSRKWGKEYNKWAGQVDYELANDAVDVNKKPGWVDPMDLYDKTTYELRKIPGKLCLGGIPEQRRDLLWVVFSERLTLVHDRPDDKKDETWDFVKKFNDPRYREVMKHYSQRSEATTI